MAMVMCNRFNVLKDDINLNPEKPWEGFLYKMKRRLANKKPTINPQGPTSKKARRQIIIEENIDAVDVSNEVSVQQDGDYDAPAMASHYTLLKKKLDDKQPNQKVIKQLLDLEFPSRRKFVDSLKTNKMQTIVEAYPCFLKAVHIVDEIRRYVSDDTDFLVKCTERLDSLWESLFLWGIRKNLFSPSLDKANGAREKEIFKNLTTMFPSVKKPKQALLTVLDSDDNVDQQVKKTKSPAIISTPTSIIIAAGGQSFGILKATSWTRSVLVLLGVHYTFMLPYAVGTESVLSMLQTQVLCDNIHESDVTKEYRKTLEEFQKFLG